MHTLLLENEIIEVERSVFAHIRTYSEICSSGRYQRTAPNINTSKEVKTRAWQKRGQGYCTEEHRQWLKL